MYWATYFVTPDSEETKVDARLARGKRLFSGSGRERSGPWSPMGTQWALGRQAGHISKGRLPLEEAGLAGHMGLV